MVYYASKTLNEAQSNYTTIQKKLLAIVYVLDKFRAYLEGVIHCYFYRPLYFEVSVNEKRC